MAEQRKIILQVGVDDSQIEDLIAQIDRSGVAGDKAAKKIKESFKVAGQQIATNNGLDKFNESVKSAGSTSTNLVKQLRALKRELNELELSGQNNTKRFAELSKEAGVLQDTIGDVAARTKVLASDTRRLDAVASAVTGLAGAYAAVQGAVALFGKENDQLQKQLLKVQSALAVVNGLQAAFAALNKDSAAAVTANAIATRAATAVYSLFSKTINTTSTSFKVLKGVITSLGIGALLVGVGLLIENFDKLTDLFSSAPKKFDAAGFGELFDRFAKDIGRQNEQLERQLKNSALLAELEKKRLTAAGELEVSRLQLAQASEIEILNAKEKTAEKIAQVDQRLLNEEKDVRKQQLDLINTLNARIAAQGIQLTEEQREQIQKYTDSLVDAQRDVNAKIDELEIQRNFNTQKNELDRIKIIVAEVDKFNQQFQAKAKELGDKVLAEVSAQLKREQELRKINGDTLRSIIQTQLQLIIEDATTSENNRVQAIKQLLSEETNARIAELEASKAARIAAGESAVAVQTEIDAKIRLEREKLKNDINAIDEQQAERTRQIQQETLQAAADAFASSVQLAGALGQAQIQNLESQKEFELKNAGDNAKKREEIEIRFAAKRAEIQRKQAIAEKVSAAFSAAVNGAAAITKALATSPLLAAFVAAAVATQIATIAAAPIPKFEKGGTVRGKRHREGGTIIEAEEGEEIISRKPAIKHRKVLKEINKGNFEKYVFKNYVQPVIDRQRGQMQVVNVNAKLETSDLRQELYKTRKQSERTNKTLIKFASQKSNPRSQW
jgi:hypothetical protein